MCQFITLIFPSKSVCERLRDVFPTYCLAPNRVENRSVRAQLKPEEAYYVATAGLCQCGTGLGSLAHTVTRASLEESREEAKRVKKGWSAPRIARWKAERKEAEMRQEEARRTKYLSSAERWRAFLLATDGTRLGILLHWYGSSVQDEVFGTLARRFVPRVTLTVEMLMHLEEDTIYEFD